VELNVFAENFLDFFAENFLDEEYFVFQCGDLAAALGDRLSCRFHPMMKGRIQVGGD
jgi:hypothetical protein